MDQIVEPGQGAFVTAVTGAPALPYPKISVNGAAFVTASNTPVNMGEGMHGLQLTGQETGKAGTVVVVWTNGGARSTVQVRGLVGEVTNSALGQMKEATGGLQQSIAKAATDQHKALRDALNTYLMPQLQVLKPRHPETGKK